MAYRVTMRDGGTGRGYRCRHDGVFSAMNFCALGVGRGRAFRRHVQITGVNVFSSVLLRPLVLVVLLRPLVLVVLCWGVFRGGRQRPSRGRLKQSKQSNVQKGKL